MHENRAGVECGANAERAFHRLRFARDALFPIKSFLQPIAFAFLDHLRQFQSEGAGLVREIENGVDGVAPGVEMTRRMFAVRRQLRKPGLA